ncbi:MAG: LamG domain-containing protein [Oscillospiraceae bacterium]|jgi:hypothetical protein|nr:LamG domain-containing protein [Oscillospiraceae bacterium]
MKKLLLILMCALIAATLFASCAAQQPAEVSQEPAPAAKYHYSFDDASGLAAVTQVEKAADSVNTGATYDIAGSDHEILFSNGPVGSCLYLDGQYGVKLTDIAALGTDAYTVSFWLNADRLSIFGPTLQLGRNMGYADDGDETVTWLNFTKSDWDGDIFPVVWNRNSSTGAWPWVYAADQAEHGKREWLLITLVASGDKYTYSEDNLERVGCKFYLNGEVAFDASADLNLYGGLATEILTGDGVEGYIGVNYWDTIYKGFIDELYIFDSALTDSQVAALYAEGDPAVESVAPVETEEEPEPPAAPPAEPAPVDESAVDVVGRPERDLAFWSDWSDAYELADGATVTVKMNNYSDGINNWDNFLAAFVNVKTVGHTAPADQFADYAEYAVVRADAYGWGDASYEGTFETSWGDDWAAWLELMKDAEVTAAFTRNGGDITITVAFTGADGAEMTETALVKSTLTADAPCYFFILGEACYIEILSVE